MDDGGDSYGDSYGADAFLATTATTALSLFSDADFEPRGAERRPREAERRTSSICAAHAAPPAPWRSAAAAGGRRSSEEGLRSAAAPGRRQSHDEPRASLHTTPGGTGVGSWTPARRPARELAAEALAEAIGGSVPAAPAAPAASLRSASALGAGGEGGAGGASPPSASPPAPAIMMRTNLIATRRASRWRRSSRPLPRCYRRRPMWCRRRRRRKNARVCGRAAGLRAAGAATSRRSRWRPLRPPTPAPLLAEVPPSDAERAGDQRSAACDEHDAAGRRRSARGI